MENLWGCPGGYGQVGGRQWEGVEELLGGEV